MSEVSVDEQLVARAQAGDIRAFELLFRKYQHKIVQLVSRLVGDADAPWLYRIGINTAKNHLVSMGRRPSGRDSIDVADAELYGHTEHLSDIDTPEAHLLSDEIKQKIFDVISNLPADLRQAITLRELEGLSYEEIAEVMQCPIGTVRSRIFRAREAIDAVVGPLMRND